MAVIAAGMAITAITATAVAPIRHAGRGDRPPTATAGGVSGTPEAAGAAGAAQPTG